MQSEWKIALLMRDRKESQDVIWRSEGSWCQEPLVTGKRITMSGREYERRPSDLLGRRPGTPGWCPMSALLWDEVRLEMACVARGHTRIDLIP